MVKIYLHFKKAYNMLILNHLTKSNSFKFTQRT